MHVFENDFSTKIFSMSFRIKDQFLFVANMNKFCTYLDGPIVQRGFCGSQAYTHKDTHLC